MFDEGFVAADGATHLAFVASEVLEGGPRRCGQIGAHDDRETVDSIWISPREALRRNAAKDFDLMNVTRFQLEALAQFDSAQSVLEMAAENDSFPVSRPIVPVDLPVSGG